MAVAPGMTGVFTNALGDSALNVHAALKKHVLGNGHIPELNDLKTMIKMDLFDEIWGLASEDTSTYEERERKYDGLMYGVNRMVEDYYEAMGS